MLSRVAESLYWTSRYLERAEHTIRLLDINLGLMLDKSHTSAERRWIRVLAALGNPAEIRWEGDAYKLVQALCFDANSPASVVNCIISARENARQIREEISTEQWQRLNRLFHEVSRARSSRYSDLQFAEFLPTVVDGIHLFQGVTDTTLTHGEGWQFLQVGRFMERASATAMLLDVYHREVTRTPEESFDAYEYLEWVGLLRSCTAFEAYCKVNTADLTYERMIEFLLLNAEFPHSIRYSLDQMHRSLTAIQQQSHQQNVDELMRVSGKLRTLLGYDQISDVFAAGPGNYLRRILEECHRIHDLIYKAYIQYSVQAALAM